MEKITNLTNEISNIAKEIYKEERQNCTTYGELYDEISRKRLENTWKETDGLQANINKLIYVEVFKLLEKEWRVLEIKKQ